MSSTLLQSPPRGVATARALVTPLGRHRGGWELDALAGRYVEITGGASSAALTAARGIVLEAQQRSELVAWIGKRDSIFFPPDFAAAGVDLEALLVVFAADQNEGLRATDILFRSGAFGVIVFDMGKEKPVPLAAQSRLAGLAKEYHTAFLEITPAESDRKTRGSLVSLRVEAKRERMDRDHFRVEIHASKDKQSLSGWTHTEICHGPDGLC